MPGFVVLPSDKSLINPKYFCQACTLVLNNPVQTLCGHFYCFTCVDDLKGLDRRDYKCVKDNIWFTKEEIFLDRCVRREVDNIPVHCPRKCPWKGFISQLQEHNLECPFSKKEEPVIADSAVHTGCVYEIIGCKIPKNLTADQLKEHNERSAEYHIKLLFKYIHDASREEMSKHIDRLTVQITGLKNKITVLENATKALWGTDVNALLRRLVNSENNVANLELLVMESNQTNEQMNGRIQQLERHRANDAKVITILKNKLGLNEQNPRDSMRYPIDELTAANDGILLWKITDFQRKRTEAQTGQRLSFTSPPFYSDRYGYKMCARIYLNGDGLGRENYLSLFFVIMRGEYDALLRWPFRQKVTMMLLDQDHVEHVIDAFKPDPLSSSFKRPTADMNVASGCPMFCPLADLDKHAYVKDDIMFVKIIVDTSEIY